MISHMDFRRFDHGAKINLEKYGQRTPPILSLSDIKVPVAIFSGDMDMGSDPTDVAWLEKDSGLSTLVFSKQYHFYHQSFQIAKDMSYVEGDLIPQIKAHME